MTKLVGWTDEVRPRSVRRDKQLAAGGRTWFVKNETQYPGRHPDASPSRPRLTRRMEDVGIGPALVRQLLKCKEDEKGCAGQVEKVSGLNTGGEGGSGGRKL